MHVFSCRRGSLPSRTRANTHTYNDSDRLPAQSRRRNWWYSCSLKPRRIPHATTISITDACHGSSSGAVREGIVRLQQSPRNNIFMGGRTWAAQGGNTCNTCNTCNTGCVASRKGRFWVTTREFCATQSDGGQRGNDAMLEAKL